jgi:NAD(P)-dependent dehydrogenase (short-subunit alcohol dehydrogenase family)
MNFKDKVIFITGGTSGIGLATAVKFAKEGAAHVIVCGRRESKWQEAQDYLQKNLSSEQKEIIEYRPCDVRIEQQVHDIIKNIYEDYGRLDVCFNNAGVQPGVVSNTDSGFIGDMLFESFVDKDGSILYRVPAPQPQSNPDNKYPKPSASQFTSVSPYCESEIATSCFGVFYCLKWQMNFAFEKQPKDLPVSIINTSSRNGIIPDSHRPLYASSKAFILSLTKIVATQAAQRVLKEKRASVRINSITPGPIDTPLELAAFPGSYENYVAAACKGVPMKRTGQPEEIAPAVLFLADPNASGYVTGTNIAIDGGHTGSPILG